MRTVLLLASVLVGAAGCGSRCPPDDHGASSCASHEPMQHLPIGNKSFTLHVSNQSFDLDPVDIKIELDDQLAVTGAFDVGSQHTWVQFDMGLTAGTHRIKVTTADLADVILDQTFVMDDRKYGVVSFWYDQAGAPEPTPPHFAWNITDEAPLFD